MHAKLNWRKVVHLCLVLVVRLVAEAVKVGDVRTVAVEDWLGTLELANASKAKVRNVFHALYGHAHRYEWFDKNPITKVRQSAQRAK